MKKDFYLINDSCSEFTLKKIKELLIQEFDYQFQDNGVHSDCGLSLKDLFTNEELNSLALLANCNLELVFNYETSYGRLLF